MEAKIMKKEDQLIRRQNCTNYDKLDKKSRSSPVKSEKKLNKISQPVKTSLEKRCVERKKTIFVQSLVMGSKKDVLKETSIVDLVIYDGFHIPVYNHSRLRLAQTYLAITDHGYYKNSQMVLTNHELYLYKDRYQDDYDKLLILTPGVFVKAMPVVTLKINKHKPDY